MEKNQEKEYLRDYNQKIREILDADLPAEEKKELLSQYHENDIAEILEELDEEARKEIYAKAMQGVEAFVTQYNKENEKGSIKNEFYVS